MIKFYDVEVPVLVREDGKLVDARPMRITVMVPADATPEDAVEELRRRIQNTCNTMDTGDDE